MATDTSTKLLMETAWTDIGEDAFSNLYDVEFKADTDNGSFFDALGFNSGQIKYRSTTFTVPGAGVEVYAIDYKTTKFEKPAGKAQFDKQFTLNMRVDRNFELYNSLVRWRNYLANPESGYVGGDSAGDGNSARLTIKVTAVGLPTDANPEGAPIHNWEFKGCFLQKLGDVAFDWASQEPLKVDCTFYFRTLSETDGNGQPIGQVTIG